MKKLPPPIIWSNYLRMEVSGITGAFLIHLEDKDHNRHTFGLSTEDTETMLKELGKDMERLEHGR